MERDAPWQRQRGLVATARYAGRVALVSAALFVFATGLTLTLRSQIGLGPWNVLTEGLTRVLPLSFGQANLVIGAVVIALGWRLGFPPRVGTLLNMTLVSLFVDLQLGLDLIPSMADAPFLWRLLLNVLGIGLVGLGTGLYLKPGLGAGPRDGLMLGLQRRTGLRVALVRGGIEVTVCVLGGLLGGTLGIGTVLFALGIGPAVEASFRLLRVRPARPR
jgi:uncharacterized protein